MMDDAELLRRYAREGSEPAFAEFVRRHVAMVYGSALRQLNGDAHTAEDVVQLVFTRLARDAHRLAGHPSLAGWLFVTTRHAAAKSIRHRQRRLARERKALAMEETSPEPQADWTKLRPVLDEAVARLEATDREAVILRFFEQRAFAEIGAALQLSEDAARKRVDRALDKLRVLLAQREIASTVAALAVVLAHQPALALPANFATTISRAALGSAAGSGAPLLRVVQPVLQLKPAIGVGLAAVAVSVAVFLHARQARHAAEWSLAAARTGLAAQLASAADINARWRVAGATTRPAQPAATPAAARDPLAAGADYLRAHPEVKAAMVQHSRAKLNFRYAPLYRDLGLSPRQIEAFQDLVRELEPANSSEGLDGSRIAWREGDGLPRAEVEARLRALLGPDGYAAFQAARGKVPAARLVFELAEALYFTDAPLNANQSTQLIDAIAAARTGRTYDWDAITAQAETFLTARQNAALRGLRAQDEVASLIGFRWIGALPAPSATFVPDP